MARALHSNSIRASLGVVASFYHLSNKRPDVLDKTKGVRDLPDELMQELGVYCAVDTELCRAIFDRMLPHFPTPELDLIDMTIRMFCDPILRIDTERVQQELEKELAEKQKAIEEAGVSMKELCSAAKLSEKLLEFGVVPPTKLSKRQTDDYGDAVETWAFSKSDLAFLELKDHQDVRVRKLIAGRLAAKSTIGELGSAMSKYFSDLRCTPAVGTKATVLSLKEFSKASTVFPPIPLA